MENAVEDVATPIDPEQRAQFEEEWRAELAKTEDEINTLKQVLASKQKESAELKRKLGITAWKEWTTDLAQGAKNLQETTAYQKTTETVKGLGERTSSLFGSLGVGAKLAEMKNSTAFKSFEERVGTAVGTVKNKMSGSRSNSTNDFEEALNTMEQQRAAQGTKPSTIPENGVS